MENNRLSSFPGSFFTSLPNLLFLNLNGNFLTDAPLDLPKSLQSLKLERNQLKMLRAGEVKQLANLSELCLSENQISSADGVQYLSSLTRLELAGNKLQAIPLGLPATLWKIDCSNNLIGQITAPEFQNLQDLKHLFLDNNSITTFENGALQKCTLLSNLALEQNLLSSIPLSLPQALARLDLKGNNIQGIKEQELSNLRHLQVLNLRNNKISSLDSSLLKHLPRLRYLYLDGNPWNCTCDLLRTGRALMTKGTEVKWGQCTSPMETQGESWMLSKRILDLCAHHNPYLTDEAEEIEKKANGDEPPNLKGNTDDYYDYEID
ncbi:hypothetical protein JRQ81_007516 [Phrynocephalus forsythii]|uniref:Uncharacterized protein n=1 Tax=Phrynocephalus forsythii TaxID=171643 RepID=A0A9Q1B6M0_9SAUR|nr:hypothetical protein JRQ81_007516 [Phrynocephalus forsythii]